MRKWLPVGVVVGLVCVVAVALSVMKIAAQGAAKAGEDEPRAVGLPISRVLLFSSGVGHFLREGSVTGDARIDLSFPVSDINDLIKSLVVRDLDDGHISAVSYDSSAPVERTLKSFAVNLTSNPTLESILNQARGERVEVVPAAGVAATLSGSIVGVEKQKTTIGKDDHTVESAVLNLWCADGVRSVKLSEVQRIKFLSSALESEFKKALDTLAKSHDTQKKAVAVRCVGEGKRRIQIGYVVENPVWKTSYRLVLGTKQGKKAPYLQGWAVVENSTDEDWRDVRMGLISGRPISFQMDLYQPLFMDRPTIQLEQFASLRPVAYSGSLDDLQRQKDAAASNTQQSMPPGVGGLGGMGFGRAEQKKEQAPRKRDEALRLNEKADADKEVFFMQQNLAQNMNLSQGVTTAATAAKLGDYFQYAIDKPVTLPRQKSALLPIVGKDVEAKRVSIYNQQVQPKFPLLGLRFKNISGVHLMQGPITIFEGSSYAGDAIINDLQPNEERLVSYAVDLGTEVNPSTSTDSGRYLSFKAVKGVLQATSKVKRTRIYRIKNRTEEERVVLVEQAIDKNFKLIGDKPTETAADVYRFEVKVPATKTADLTVTEERDEMQRIEISSESDERLRFFASQPLVSASLKKGLEQAMTLRLALMASQREAADLSRQLKVITDDQMRLRENIKATPNTAQVYKKYLKKLDDQEEQIEKLQQMLEKHKADEHAKKKAFDDFIANFNAE